MKHRLLNLLAGILLVMFVATVVLWTRSYRKVITADDRDVINFTRTDPIWWIISYPGEAVLCRQTGKDWDGHDLPRIAFAGIVFEGTQAYSGGMLWNLHLPYWFLSVLTLVGPLIILRGRLKSSRLEYRTQHQLCLKCGYDLRATPVRCPECGTVPSAPA